MNHLLARLRSAFASSVPPAPDLELLSRFLDRNDQDAFAELVRRYGPMVLGVCRRTLGDGPDAEDAYQAVFLILAQRAETVQTIGRVAGWLHGVATLTAKKARGRRAKRRLREQAAGLLTDVPATDCPVSAELAGVIDTELAAIPEKYRTAVVLCELRQLTLDQAAAELGVPRGTVASRLARGREALGRRLLRRGLLAIPPLPTLIPPPAVEPTSTAHSLSREVLQTMTVSNLRWIPLAVLPLVTLAVMFFGPAPSNGNAAPVPKADGKDKPVLDRVALVGIGGMLEQPTIRKSLALTKVQEDKIAEIGKAVETKNIAARKALLTASGKQQLDLDELQQMNDAITASIAEYDRQLSEVLVAGQLTRLRQIQLQRDEPAMLVSPHAVRVLNLTADQEEQMAGEVAKVQTRGNDLLPGIAHFANAGKQPLITKMVQQRTTAQNKVRDAILKHLTAEQKETWSTLVGDRMPSDVLYYSSPEVLWAQLTHNSHK